MKTSALKRTLAGALAVLCVAGTLPANVDGGGLFDTAIVAKAAVTNWDSGDCTITFDSDSGTMTVSKKEGDGTGAMADYNYNSSAPWNSINDQIKTVVIGNKVTSIGKYSFIGCRNLTSVTIPKGVTSIGDDAFSFCNSLESIVLPDGLTSIGEYAFYSCGKLTEVNIPGSVTSIGDGAIIIVRELNHLS